MTISIKDQNYDNFLENSIAGLEQQLYSLITNRRDKRDKRVIRTHGDNALYDLMKEQGKERVNFPFITTQLGTLSENTEGYNARELKRSGIYIKKPKETGADLDYLILHPNAVKLNIQVRFIAQNEQDILFFSKRWYDSLKNGYFNFEMMIYTAPIMIKVTGDPTITYPELTEIVADTGNVFLADTSGIDLHTYIMTRDRAPAIKRFVVGGYGLRRDQPVEPVIVGDDVVAETFFKDDTEQLTRDGYEFINRKTRT